MHFQLATDPRGAIFIDPDSTAGCSRSACARDPISPISSRLKNTSRTDRRSGRPLSTRAISSSVATPVPLSSAPGEFTTASKCAPWS